jgi:hypothetical protein
MVCPEDKPRDLAAARWLGWIERIPLRITSATYAEYVSTTATVPRKITLLDIPFKPSAGTPKPTKRIIKISGAPLKISTYAVARYRNGVSVGDFVVRRSANPSAITPMAAPPIKVN